MRHISGPNRLFLIYIIILVMPLLAGCSNRDTQTTPQIEDMLPEGWSPLEYRNRFLPWFTTVWTPINVDNTTPEEYLLFFKYDSGQIGAAIYEQLPLGSSGVLSPTPIPAPNQPSSSFIPYRLAPSYWQGSGAAGYIAEPGTEYDQLTILQLQRDPVSELESGVPPTNTQTVPVKELVIFGGNTLMTVAWWQNPYNGYGVAQVRGRAGLVQKEYQDGDSTKPVVSVIGLDPLPDPLGRSIMCQQTMYVRSPADELPTTLPEPYARAIHYTGNDEGIVFCHTPLPAYPFYPEGIALAFLRPDNRDDPEQTLEAENAYRLQFVQGSDATKMKEWLALFDFDGPDNDTMPTIIVDELVSPSTLVLTEEYRTAGSPPLTTVVCAFIQSPDKRSSKVLLVHMQHQPPAFLPTPAPSSNQSTPERATTTDRMIITNVTDQTATNLSCQQLVNDAMAASGQTGSEP